MTNYIHQILVALDHLANTLAGGLADETLSALAHRMRVKQHKYWGWTASAIDLLFFWQKDEQGNRNHCFQSYVSEQERKHLPEHYR